MKFVGRKRELQELNDLYKGKESKLAVLYGRRRVGKSTLIDHFTADKKHLRFEGLEGERTQAQIANFVLDLSKQTDNELLRQVKLTSWDPVFDFLTKLFSHSKEKYIILWMNSSGLLLIKLALLVFSKYIGISIGVNRMLCLFCAVQYVLI